MNHEFIAAIITSVFTSGSGVTILQWWLSKKQKDRDDEHARAQKKRDDEQAERDRERAQEAADSKIWFEQSQVHYKTAKDEVAEAKKECATCKEELRATRKVIYTLLEDLEDQIIPMMMLPASDPLDVRQAARAAVHKARDAL